MFRLKQIVDKIAALFRPNIKNKLSILEEIIFLSDH